jgi:para-nitrobenzyl esterase
MKMREKSYAIRLLAGLLAISAFTVGSAGAASASSVVKTKVGSIQGVEMFGLDAFLGIPYAKPPLKALRWKPPKPHAKFKGVFQANQFGNFCEQPGDVAGTMSEDCLTLNVFRPIGTTNQELLPVMVWIHGGGLVSGGSFLYDPSPLVLNGNVIVVTINYRLGLLGFFAHPAIDAEGHRNGNYGLMDQQLALKWVKHNIKAFGGDPGRVTIFGESAGGQSVLCNLASPTAAGLFQRAIEESGAYLEFQFYYNYITTLGVGETTGTAQVPPGTAIAASVGCPNQTAACLRALPASTLVGADPSTAFPFVDGTILTQTPTAAITSGHFNRVPVISGTNHDEWRVFVNGQYGASLVTEADYEAAVLALWTNFFDSAVLAAYPLDSYPSGGIALGTSGTDGIYACPARNADQLLSKFVTTYAYEFNDENAPDLENPTPSFPLGSYHGAEVQYLFDLNLRFSGTDPFTADQQQLSDAMISYWTTFAANGDPNSADKPVWSPYSIMTDEFQSLVPPTPVAESGFNADHKCTTVWSAF